MRRRKRYLILLLALVSIYGLNELVKGSAGGSRTEAPAGGGLSPGAVIAGERVIVAAFVATSASSSDWRRVTHYS
jgi:hypothetical protein